MAVWTEDKEPIALALLDSLHLMNFLLFQDEHPNTESNGQYLGGCKAVGVKGHPARFPARLPEFFIRFLTEPGDLVIDIFAGSNTTGSAAEHEGRRWLAFEERLDYLAASAFRFLPKGTDCDILKSVYERISSEEPVDLAEFNPQVELFGMDGTAKRSRLIG